MGVRAARRGRGRSYEYPAGGGAIRSGGSRYARMRLFFRGERGGAAARPRGRVRVRGGGPAPPLRGLAISLERPHRKVRRVVRFHGAFSLRPRSSVQRRVVHFRDSSGGLHSHVVRHYDSAVRASAGGRRRGSAARARLCVADADCSEHAAALRVSARRLFRLAGCDGRSSGLRRLRIAAYVLSLRAVFAAGGVRAAMAAFEFRAKAAAGGGLRGFGRGRGGGADRNGVDSPVPVRLIQFLGRPDDPGGPQDAVLAAPDGRMGEIGHGAGSRLAAVGPADAGA